MFFDGRGRDLNQTQKKTIIAMLSLTYYPLIRARNKAADLPPLSKYDQIFTANAAASKQKIEDPVLLSFCCYRKRLGDVDGLSVKAIIDGLVDAGFFPDDSGAYISGITLQQKKVTGPAAVERLEIAY